MSISTDQVIVDDQNVVVTLPDEQHRQRRAPLNPYFSKSSIRRLEPIIQNIISKLMKRLDSAALTGDVLSMRVVYKSLTSDVINAYTFGYSDNDIDKEDFNGPLWYGMEQAFKVIYVLALIEWLAPFLRKLPDSLAVIAMPAYATTLKKREVLSHSFFSH